MGDSLFMTRVKCRFQVDECKGIIHASSEEFFQILSVIAWKHYRFYFGRFAFAALVK